MVQLKLELVQMVMMVLIQFFQQLHQKVVEVVLEVKEIHLVQVVQVILEDQLEEMLFLLHLLLELVIRHPQIHLKEIMVVEVMKLKVVQTTLVVVVVELLQ